MNKLKSIRKELGISQNELGDKIGYDRSLISKWENQSVEMSLGQKIDVSQALDIPLSFFEDNGMEEFLNKTVKEKTRKRNKIFFCALIELNIYNTLGIIFIFLALFDYKRAYIITAIVFESLVLTAWIVPFIANKLFFFNNSTVSRKRDYIKELLNNKEWNEYRKLEKKWKKQNKTSKHFDEKFEKFMNQKYLKFKNEKSKTD